MKKGIIFDLDGTLWDSIDHVVMSWNEILLREGYNNQITRDELISHVGKPMDVIMAELAPDVPPDERERLMEICVAHENEYVAANGGFLYPGLEDALIELREKYNLYIVSNCQDGYIEAFYAYHGLGGYFSDHECWGVTGKPKGENIRMVIERNHLDKAIYVGDTSGDETASRKAAISFVLASYGFGEAKSPDAVISSPGDLPRIVGRFLDV